MLTTAIISVVVAVIFGTLGWRIGYTQGKIAQKALDLEFTKAIPKIGTTARIESRQENPPAYPAFYYLVVTIYNEGDLAARQLKGECRVYSATKSVKDREIPIDREFLGRGQYELERYRLTHGTSGMTVNLTGLEGENSRFNVDIEFKYSGISDGGPQQYKAQYTYDNKSRQLKKL